MASELLVNKITPESGTTLTLGESGDTIAITSGASLTGFTSTGIDDNATNTAITIDSSQNVGIGTTSPSVTFDAEANGATVAHFNRTTDDGNILELQKDGTTVGSIGYISSGLYIDGESGHAGLRFGGADISPRDGGADADAAIQLGSSSNRFTDLYLSGSVYLGGTTSANALDDYEEGTWTPTLIGSGGNPTVTYTIRNGLYIKIGNTVFIQVRIQMSAYSGGVDRIQISGLPFTVSNNPSMYASLNPGLCSNINFGSGYTQLTAIFDLNSTNINLLGHQSNASYRDLLVSDISSSSVISFTGFYSV